MVTFAPWTALVVIFLQAQSAGTFDAVLMRTRLGLSSTCTALSVIGLLFTVLGLVGSKQAARGAFPRNSIFHLALSTWLYTVFHLACFTGFLDQLLPPVPVGAGHVIKGAYVLQDFFRVQAMWWSVVRVYITLYLVPTRGVKAAAAQWNTLLAVAWIMPLLGSLATPALFTLSHRSMFPCWIQYGIPQLEGFLVIHLAKLLFCGVCLALCWSRRGEGHAAAARGTVELRRSEQGSSRGGLEEHITAEAGMHVQGGAHGTVAFQPTSSVGASNMDWSLPEATTLPEDTLRTEAYACVLILNGIFHQIFIGAILNGQCGDIDTEDGTCSLFVGMVLFLGVILEDGQGLVLTLLFGTRPHVLCGVIKLFQTPTLVLRSCCHGADIKQSVELFPRCGDLVLSSTTAADRAMLGVARPSRIPSLRTHFARAGIEWRRCQHMPFAWRGHTKRRTTRARPSPDLAVWLE